MKRTALYGPLLVVPLVLTYGHVTTAAEPPASIPNAHKTQAVVAAATAFLNTLDADQRAKVQFAFKTQPAATAATFARNGGQGGGGGRGPGGGGGGGGGPGGRRPDDGGGTRDAGPGPGTQPSERRGGPGGPGGGNRRGPGGGGGGGGGGFAGFVGEKYGDSVWSNFPVSDVPRPGLQLGSLNSVQREAAMHLLQALLSAKGYQKVIDVMGSDQALHESGTPYASGNDVYTLGLFGTPSATAPWMVQFGGHHLGLNVVIVGDQGVMTPTMTGAMPAVYTVNGKTVRVLAGENDKAFALLDTLDEPQKKQAILNYSVRDLVFAPGQGSQAVQPEGIKASAMNETQRAILMDVISEWAGIVSDTYASGRLAEIRSGLDDTYFAWSGPTTHEPGKNGRSYYRIQGPKLIIEFSPQGVGGDPAMHVHTVYRDPTNEYGRALVK